MISLDHTIVLQIVLFLLLWIILSKVLFRPYLALLEERERKTQGAEGESTTLEHEGERLRAQYEDGIAKAQGAGAAAKEAILQEARQQRESLLNRAREEALSTLERVRLDIRNELTREREIAAREARVIAQEMVGKVLGRGIG